MNAAADTPRRLRVLSAHLLAAGSGGAAPVAVIAGIQAYQAHPFRREDGVWPVVWRAGAARLFAVSKNPGAAARRILLIPSLINGAEILDLLPSQSFAGWLAGQGHDVYLLDWGQAAADEEMATLDGIVRERLAPALRWLSGQSGPVDAIGYCLGGTLLAGAAMLAPAALRSLSFLASPWDFQAGGGLLTGYVRAAAPSALQMIGATGRLPADWIQTAFAQLGADRVAAKFARFAAMDPDSDEARLFVATEDWLNGGQDLPGAAAQALIRDWYGANAPALGAWRIDGVTADPASLSRPTLIVAAADDRLVPPESARALAPSATVLSPPGGHIGLMTGRRARREVWPAIGEWLRTVG